jgi:hypothetical protein
MGVGVIRDQTLKRRDPNVSHALGCVGKSVVCYESIK